jgi:hypothetical protein
MLVYHNFTKRSSNLAPFGKISKSGDDGDSGDIFGNKGGHGSAVVSRRIKIIIWNYKIFLLSSLKDF